MNLLWLSTRIFRRYQKYSKAFELTAFFASILFLLVLTISQGLSKVVSNVSEDNLYIKTIMVDSYYEKSDGVYTKNIFTSADLQLLSRLEGVKSIYLRYSIESEDMNLSLDGHTIRIRDKITGVDEEYSIFSETNRKHVLDNYHFSDDPIISGVALTSQNTMSAIMDENFIYKMGYENTADVIGSTFTISIGSKYVENILIIGVYDYRYGTNPGMRLLGQGDSLRNLSNYGTLCPFIVTHDVIQSLASDLDETKGQQFILVYTNSIGDVTPTYDYIYSNFKNDISCSLIESQEIAERMDNVSKLIILFSSIVFLVSMMSVITGLFSKMYTQRGFIRMMSIMGYTSKDILKVYLYEHIIALIKLDFIIAIFAYGLSFISEYLLKPFYQAVANDLNHVFIVDIKNLILFCIIFNVISIFLVSFTLLFKVKSYMFKKGS